jgi:hypothetical protein
MRFEYLEIKLRISSKKKFKIFCNPFNLKESANDRGLSDYFTGTYLSTNYSQVIHNRYIWVKNAVLIFRFIPLHLYT